MVNVSELMQVPSSAAILEFPDYFGNNWDALDECICDLDWLPTTVGYLLVITDPAMIMSGEAAAENSSPNLVFALLTNAQREWGTPVEVGERWDRPALPFIVVLVSNEAD